jgi:hypothetical protein
MENLHVCTRALILHYQKKAVVGFFGIAQIESSADSLPKPITVLKFASGPQQERIFKVDELNHSLLRNFPEYTLVRRPSGYIDCSAPLKLGALTSFGAVHGLKHVISCQFVEVYRSFPFVVCDYGRVIWEDSYCGGIGPPIESGWQSPVVLEVNEQPRITTVFLRPQYLSDGSIRPPNSDVGSLIRTGSGDAGIQRGLCLPIACVHRFRSIVGNPLFLSDHAFGSLFNLVGCIGHTLHFLGLGFGSNSEIVGISGTAVNLLPLFLGVDRIEDSGDRNYNCCGGSPKIRTLEGSPNPTVLNPTPGGLQSLKGWAYVITGGVCFLFSLVLFRAGFCERWDKWYFGIFAILVGIALLKGFIELVRHGAELLDPSLRESVTQKYLTFPHLCNTVIDMANVLPIDKQIAVIGALAEGSSIRSIERLTGIHRDTIMRLGVRVGKGCEMLLDSKMQDLSCNYLQLDEVWGFIGKKERHVTVLHLHPIKSAQDAVRAAILQEFRRLEPTEEI